MVGLRTYKHPGRKSYVWTVSLHYLLIADVKKIYTYHAEGERSPLDAMMMMLLDLSFGLPLYSLPTSLRPMSTRSELVVLSLYDAQFCDMKIRHRSVCCRIWRQRVWTETGEWLLSIRTRMVWSSCPASSTDNTPSMVFSSTRRRTRTNGKWQINLRTAPAPF